MTRAILVVSPFLPWPADFGGALRVYHLVRQLSVAHEVMLLAPATREEHSSVLRLGEICDVTAVPARWTVRHAPGWRKRGVQLTSMLSGRSFLERATRNPQAQAALDRLFLTRRVDLVQFEFSQTAMYRLPRSCPTVIDAHNIEHELLERVARTNPSTIHSVVNLLEARKVRRLERHLWLQSTLNVATSRRDADRMTAVSGRPTFVVPNGVDLNAFAGVDARPRRAHHAVFVGAMRHAPNADGARWYIERVHGLVRDAIPGATIAIVGADPPADLVSVSTESVSVVGRVDDVRPLLTEASVAVVPLHAGGGTRLKILEAFAAGVPVVSTTLGAEGLDAVDGENILLADTPSAFAAAVIRLMRERELAGRIRASALELARERYGWSTVADQLVAAHDVAMEMFDASPRQ